MRRFKFFGMIIAAVLFSLTVKAGGFIIGCPTDSLTNQSGVVNFFLTSAPGNYQVITHFNGLPADTSGITSGAGSKSRRYVGLTPSTNYTGIIVIKNGSNHDTLSTGGTFNFTTSATPIPSTLTGTFIAPNKLRITGSTNHSMYIYSIYGIGMTYNLTSNTILVKAGNVDSTLTLSVVNPATTYNQLLLTYGGPYVTNAGTSSNPMNRGGGSFTTPSVMFSRITGNTPSVYVDSARISVNLTIGNQMSTANITMMIYDTFGTNMSSVMIPSQNTGLVSKTFSGLNPNSFYTYKVYCYEGANKTDSVSGNFRTLQVPAPSWGTQSVIIKTTNSIKFTQTIDSNGLWNCSKLTWWYTYTDIVSGIVKYSDTFKGGKITVTITKLKPGISYMVTMYASNCWTTINRGVLVTTTPPPPAPIFDISGGVEVSCGELKIMHFGIGISAGDTVDVYFKKSVSGSNIWTTAYSTQYGVYQNFSQDISITGISGNTKYDLKVVAVSRDSVVTESVTISAKTAPGMLPSISHELISYSDSSVTVRIYGSGGCQTGGNGLKYYQVYPDNTKEEIHTSSGSSTQYDQKLTFKIKKCTDYRLRVSLENGIAGAFDPNDLIFKSRGCVAAGIENQTVLTEWNPETIISVYDLLGQKIGYGEYREIAETFKNTGLVILRDISGITKKVIFE